MEFYSAISIGGIGACSPDRTRLKFLLQKFRCWQKFRSFDSRQKFRFFVSCNTYRNFCQVRHPLAATERNLNSKQQALARLFGVPFFQQLVGLSQQPVLSFKGSAPGEASPGALLSQVADRLCIRDQTCFRFFEYSIALRLLTLLDVYWCLSKLHEAGPESPCHDQAQSCPAA
eukprot:3782564-Rhodomonas_salina.3